MELRALSYGDCEQVRIWRNECLQALRTPYKLTKEQQEDFYTNTVCNRNAKARYWGIWKIQTYEKEGTYTKKMSTFIGMCGLETIEWENRRAEISIILAPEFQGKGYGKQALRLLLEQGFKNMNLDNIWGECYTCNIAVEFWKKQTKVYNAKCGLIDHTKYWEGKYYDSFYFNFRKEDFK